jgi:hypothetical protein
MAGEIRWHCGGEGLAVNWSLFAAEVSEIVDVPRMGFEVLSRI